MGWDDYMLLVMLGQKEYYTTDRYFSISWIIHEVWTKKIISMTVT